jgi:GntR family transcriptional regulator, rspAB operon transcriptional repressor
MLNENLIGITLADEIAGKIRDKILKGEYGIGEKINESQLAEELRVSRTPVREAFKQLETEGLMESIPNRGSFALGFSKQDLEDIYSVRAAVEGLAVRWAAARITPEEITMLQDEYDIMEFYTRKKNSRRVMESNKRFHEIVYHASRSRFLIQILTSYQEYIQQSKKVNVYCGDNLDEILKEHLEIFRALRIRDADKAQEKILVHLSNSQVRAKAGIKSSSK